MDLTGLNDLCIPVLVCDREGIIQYKNQLGRKRFPFLYARSSVFKHLDKDERKALSDALKNTDPSLVMLVYKGTACGRGFVLHLAEELFIIAFFAELQPLLCCSLRKKFLESASDLQSFFGALVADCGREDSLQSKESRLLAAEAKSGALAALLLEPDLIIGQNRFLVLSLFEELFLGLRADLKHCGAQILFQNHSTPYTYRYTRSCILPLSLVKLMLFALLTTKEKRIEVELFEALDHQPYFEVRFRSQRKLPIMQDVDNLHAFAARYPRLYPMLFGYLPALIDEGCHLSLNVGEDGRDVNLRVHLTCERDNSISLCSPAEEATTLRILRTILYYSTMELATL